MDVGRAACRDAIGEPLPRGKISSPWAPVGAEPAVMLTRNPKHRHDIKLLAVGSASTATLHSRSRQLAYGTLAILASPSIPPHCMGEAEAFYTFNWELRYHIARMMSKGPAFLSRRGDAT